MRRITAVALLLLTVLFLLPMLLIGEETVSSWPAVSHLQADRPRELEAALPLQLAGSDSSPELTPTLSDHSRKLSVLCDDGAIHTMTMADYLWGVVAAEMPASFFPDALKAQAVASRTYCLSRGAMSVQAHPLAQVCTDSTCCQAWISREKALGAWGEQAPAYAQRIDEAVSDTDGLVVTYQGQLIQALFFSSAPGRTVDARAVWGNPVPYLVSVTSPEGEEVPDYHSQLTLTAKELRALILSQYPGADLSGSPESWLTDFSLESSGTVSEVSVGGITLTGGQVRKLLGLRSACFTLSAVGDTLTFHVTGYGHGVGMSQYGANAMAREGADFRSILSWYYTGAQVSAL